MHTHVNPGLSARSLVSLRQRAAASCTSRSAPFAAPKPRFLTVQASSSSNSRFRPADEGKSHRGGAGPGSDTRPNRPGLRQQVSDSLQNLAHHLRTSTSAFIKKAKLKDKAQSLGKTASYRLKDTYEVLEDNVKRTAVRVDKDLGIKNKANQAAERLKEGAKGVDVKFGVRRKVGNAVEDARRKWPMWRRQAKHFLDSPLGKFAWVAFLFWMLWSGLFFRILRVILLVWWLSPVLLLPLAGIINRKVAAQAERQARAAQEARARQQNPFGFDFQRMYERTVQQQRQRKPAEPSGPIIDAEWTTVDEGDQ